MSPAADRPRVDEDGSTADLPRDARWRVASQAHYHIARALHDLLVSTLRAKGKIEED